MYLKQPEKSFFVFLLVLFSLSSSAQIRIRIFAERNPGEALFTVTKGYYFIIAAGDSVGVDKGESVMLSFNDEKITVKPYGSAGFSCDSVIMDPSSDSCSFLVRTMGNSPVRRGYTGRLSCYPDLGTVILINTSDIEQYVAGVVRTEGGTGQDPEYYKTQAVIARTYMYKYSHRHLADGYNLCDNTHCQAFNGIATDTALLAAARSTHNLVILDQDSILIYSAFHSNCGGETSTAEDVWLSNLPYLKKVIDPYCRNSYNAKWHKTIQASDWMNYLRKSGYTGNPELKSSFDFLQDHRMTEYSTGSFTFPLQMIRKDMELKSSFFSVRTEGDLVLLEGRGYGHGVGLCQEGAMVMAAKGFDFRQIINFYYTGVMVSDIKNAVQPEEQ